MFGTASLIKELSFKVTDVIASPDNALVMFRSEFEVLVMECKPKGAVKFMVDLRTLHDGPKIIRCVVWENSSTLLFVTHKTGEPLCDVLRWYLDNNLVFIGSIASPLSVQVHQNELFWNSKECLGCLNLQSNKPRLIIQSKPSARTFAVGHGLLGVHETNEDKTRSFRLIELSTMKCKFNIHQMTASLASPVFHPRKPLLAIPAYGSVTVLDLQTFEPVKYFKLTGPLYNICWSPCGRWISCSNRFGYESIICDGETGKRIFSVPKATQCIWTDKTLLTIRDRKHCHSFSQPQLGTNCQ